MTLSINEKDKEFTNTIAGFSGCSTLNQCYTCGSCSSVCPVEKVVEDFDPRKIVHMLGMGLKENLLKSDTIWACSQCQSCVPVCPQGVRCSDIIKALRTEAVALGYADEERLFELGKFARVDRARCVSCLTCVRLCPFDAPYIKEEGGAYIDPDKCKACGICVIECPAKAISLNPSIEMRGMSEVENVRQ